MKLFIIAAWLSCVCATVDAAFMIVSGTYWDYANGENRTAILKIDTETGKTWRYVDSILIVRDNDGKSNSAVNFGWEEVPDQAIMRVNGFPVIPATNSTARSR